ncbi:MAG: hypothetical protein FWG47_02475 [Propionibacteriaceae bacterium]|nr:hypothetical protein [Propionibacteriaceae bacterium]
MTRAASLVAWLRLESRAAFMYRAKLMIGLFGWVVPLAFMALWNLAADGSGIMSANQTSAYYLVILLTTNLFLGGEIIFGFASRVYTGELSGLMLMPFPSLLAILPAPLMQALIRCAPLTVALGLLTWALDADFQISVFTALIAVLLGFFGWIASVLFCYLYALTALWIGKSEGILGLFFGFWWVLSGLVAPSVFMPGWLGWVMRLSPLWLAVGGMGELLSGVVTPSWWMPVSLGVWIAGLAALLRWAWPRAMRRFEAIGI